MKRQKRSAVGVEEVHNGEGVTPLQPTRKSGERREFPSGVQSRALAKKWIWCIL